VPGVGAAFPWVGAVVSFFHVILPQSCDGEGRDCWYRHFTCFVDLFLLRFCAKRDEWRGENVGVVERTHRVKVED